MNRWSRIEDQNLINAVNDATAAAAAAVVSRSSSNRNGNNNQSSHVLNWSNIAKQLGTNRSSTACLRRYKRHLIPLMNDKNLKVS
jgi:hypothetical protein